MTPQDSHKIIEDVLRNRFPQRSEADIFNGTKFAFQFLQQAGLLDEFLDKPEQPT